MKADLSRANSKILRQSAMHVRVVPSRAVALAMATLVAACAGADGVDPGEQTGGSGGATSLTTGGAATGGSSGTAVGGAGGSAGGTSGGSSGGSSGSTGSEITGGSGGATGGTSTGGSGGAVGTGGTGGTGGSGGLPTTGGSGGSAGVGAGGSGGAGGSPRRDGGADGAADAGRGGSGGSTVRDAAPLPAPGDGGAPTKLPVATQPCPTIQTGSMTFLGQPVRIWAGKPTAAQHGPMVIYWYATGSRPEEAVSGLGQAAIDEITSAGGLVMAPEKTSRKGTNTGNGVWYTGDFETADEVVACAIEQMHIDPRRIHASGFSAGGLQTVWMSYARSGYIASVVPYSGGLSGFGGAPALQDPSHVPSALVVHGAAGSDVVLLDFAKTSATYEADMRGKGGFSIDCNHGGGHRIPSGIAPSTWRFMKDHPFKTKPSPYAAGIPSGFPAYCVLP